MKGRYFLYKGLAYEKKNDNQAVLLNCKSILGYFATYFSIKSNYEFERIVQIPQVVIDDENVYREVISICKGVFENTQIEEIFIPQGILDIGWGFWNCRKLRKIHIHNLNPAYCDIDGVVYSKNMKTLVFYPNNYGEEYRVNDLTEHIGNMAFKDAQSLKVLYFPRSIRTIGINAFYNCRNLLDVFLPWTIKILYDNTTANYSTSARFHYKNRIWTWKDLYDHLKTPLF